MNEALVFFLFTVVLNNFWQLKASTVQVTSLYYASDFNIGMGDTFSIKTNATYEITNNFFFSVPVKSVIYYANKYTTYCS